MIRISRLASVPVLIVFGLAAPAVAQTALGTLRGAVLDEQGGALPGVTITVRQLETNTGQGTGVSISGQRPFTNGIVVDGASNQMQFYGRQANDFPQDWIQEFQVLTNSFSAEYGQAAGGMLNVITRSGANTTSGRGYGFFRDAKFDRPPFAGRYDTSKQPIFLA